jgi:hypothetical protein
MNAALNKGVPGYGEMVAYRKGTTFLTQVGGSEETREG